MFKILKNSSYRKLWLAQVISELGDGMTTLLLLYLVSTLSDDPIMFSYILIARYLPNVLLGTFVGPIIDKYSKKRLLIIADIYRFFIVISMVFAQSSILLLVILTFLLGIGTVIFEPTKSATIPKILDKESIPNAVGLSQSTMMVMLIIAPSIGGALLLTQHFTIIFIVDAFTFIISAFILLFLKIPNEELSELQVEKQNQSYRESLKEGIRVVFNSQLLIGLFALLIVSIFVFNFVNVNIYPLLLNEFKVGELHFGTLQTVMGLTGVIGSLVVVGIMKKIRTGTLIILTFIFIGIMCLIVVPINEANMIFPLIPVYIWLGLIGFTNTFINVPVNSLLLQSVPSDILGRVTGILMTAMNICNLGGLYVGGLVASSIGSIWAVMVGGILFILFSILFPLTKYFRALNISNEENQTTNDIEIKDENGEISTV